MAGITLAQAQTILDGFVNTLTTLSANPRASVTYDGRSWTYQDIDKVQTQVTHWENRVRELSAQATGTRNAGSRIGRINPYA